MWGLANYFSPTETRISFNKWEAISANKCLNRSSYFTSIPYPHALVKSLSKSCRAIGLRDRRIASLFFFATARTLISEKYGKNQFYKSSDSTEFNQTPRKATSQSGCFQAARMQNSSTITNQTSDKKLLNTNMSLV